MGVWGSWGQRGPGGSSRELTLVASFSLWLGSEAVAEEGRDLGLRSMEKDAPCARGSGQETVTERG